MTSEATDQRMKESYQNKDWPLGTSTFRQTEWKEGQLGRQKILLCDGKNLIQKYYWKHHEYLE